MYMCVPMHMNACAHEVEMLMLVYVNEDKEVLMHPCVHQVKVLMHKSRSSVHAYA